MVSDYLGRPAQVYDDKGELVWQVELDIYGSIRENLFNNKSFIPFRQLGQYEDVETGLYYNRFRYYNPQTGTYISKDPIGLAGNNPNLYAYTFDSNSEVDPFGLMAKKGNDAMRKMAPIDLGEGYIELGKMFLTIKDLLILRFMFIKLKEKN
ncbi:hypothetical protein JMI89_08255 [Frischella sp. Ac48]|nr:hypothetical protein [Frischella sp. Ac48]